MVFVVVVTELGLSTVQEVYNWNNLANYTNFHIPIRGLITARIPGIAAFNRIFIMVDESTGWMS